MASEWPIKTISECASTEPYSTQIGPFGKALMANEYTEFGVPVLRGVNVNRGRFHDDDFVFINEETADRLRKFESHPGDVLLVHKGTLGQIGLMPRTRKYARYIMGNSMMRVRCDPAKLLPEYLYYWLSSADGQHYLFSRVSQVGVPQIQTPLTTLRQAALPVPPLPEQRAIAHILGTLDDKIELNRRMNETLEAMVRALFKSWFVDFDPVRAKVEGRDAGLPKDIADLFPSRLVDSELGEVPTGWRFAPLPEVIEVNPSRALRRGTLAPYLDMANMPTRGHTPDAVIDRPFGSGMRFMNGDTLVARITPCLENGKTAYVDFLGDGQVGWGSTEYIVLRPKPSLPNEFAYCLARSAEFREFAIQSMTGSSGRQRVPAESLIHFVVVSPSQPIAELFGTLIKPLFARAAAATAESRTLAALRDTLLRRLISGEIRVKDAEKFLEEVGKC
jgi:type I restriction enzyme S subunit